MFPALCAQYSCRKFAGAAAVVYHSSYPVSGGKNTNRAVVDGFMNVRVAEIGRRRPGGPLGSGAPVCYGNPTGCDDTIGTDVPRGSSRRLARRGQSQGARGTRPVVGGQEHAASSTQPAAPVGGQQ